MQISRMLSFFPFFLFGYYAKNNKWFPFKLSNSHRKKIIMVSLIILLCAFICSVFLNDRFRTHFSFVSFYFETGYPILFCFFLRLIAYSTSFLAGISFILIISKKRSIVSRIGERSLYVYLIHGTIFYVFVQSRLLYEVKQFYLFIILTLAGVPLAILLSTDTIQKLSRPFIEPKIISNLLNNTKMEDNVKNKVTT